MGTQASFGIQGQKDVYDVDSPDIPEKRDSIKMPESSPETLDTEEFLHRVETGCWMALVIAPITYWIQGPSVSFDQFVARSVIVVIAAFGCAWIRVRFVVRRLRVTRERAKENTETGPV